MNPAALAKLLAKTIPAKLPVLIKGAPGCGKSDIVAQAAKLAGAEVILMHPVVSDPTDFKGLPAVVKGKAEFLPFGELTALIEAETLTVAFLDDLGQAPAVVQAAAMQLILARRINGHKVSDHVVFVAATNRREDKAGVTGILEPVKSRFATIVELTTSVEDWTAWALANGVPAELVAFCRFRPELFLTPGAPTNDIVNRPSPRTICNMGRLWAAGLQDLETLAGAVGQGFAIEFLGFIRLWQGLPNMDAVLLTPDTATVPTMPAALYAVATALACKVTGENAAKAMRYFVRLPQEFAMLGIRDTLRKCPKAANNPAFIQWVTDHQDLMV